MCPYACRKNAHKMASDVIILTLGFMGGILFRDRNGQEVHYKCKVSFTEKEILLKNKMHKTCSFLTPFPGHILVFGQWNFQVEAYE